MAERKRHLRPVSLRDVPREKRLLAADRVIRREGLEGMRALEVRLAAHSPSGRTYWTYV